MVKQIGWGVASGSVFHMETVKGWFCGSHWLSASQTLRTQAGMSSAFCFRIRLSIRCVVLKEQGMSKSLEP